MAELTFDVLDMTREECAAVPTLRTRLRVAETTGAQVHAMILRCQVRIEPQRRSYNDEEAEGLRDLFGQPSDWKMTQKPFMWTHEATAVQGFSGSTEVDLPITCTYDFEVVAAKYLHALREGSVPLVFLFNGTVFVRDGDGISVSPLPWHKDARWHLPVETWRATMDRYFPNSGWIRLHRDTLDALQRYKSRRALPTWEETFDSLLAQTEEGAHA